jgi:hypothetical protein
VGIIESSRFYLVLTCGIIAFFAAYMNYRETAVASWSTYLMFISAILILIVAGTMYKGKDA